MQGNINYDTHRLFLPDKNGTFFPQSEVFRRKSYLIVLQSCWKTTQIKVLSFFSLHSEILMIEAIMELFLSLFFLFVVVVFAQDYFVWDCSYMYNHYDSLISMDNVCPDLLHSNFVT